MKITRFEELLVWQKSRDLVNQTYNLLVNCRDFSFCDQIKRCAISIMNNVAEGFERRSNKELINFLNISKGSCGELRSMLYLAVDREYIKKEQFESIYSKSEEISKMLSGLIKSLKQ